MLNVSRIRENKDEIIQSLSKKGFNNSTIINDIITADNDRKSIQKQLDDILSESNIIAKTIAELYKNKQVEEANDYKNKSLKLKDISKELNEKLKQTEDKLTDLLIKVPNVPHKDVPSGKSAEDNVIVTSYGEIPSLQNKVPHWELTQKYDLINFELGNKITGAGFPLYKDKGAKLQRALINFFIDEASENGYTEYLPPLLVNQESAYATGQLPDKDGQMYFVNEDNLYLIPTAEVPITNIHRDVIYRKEELPIKNVAYSACFRREAGSYGKDVRGLNRLHQFDKVEIVQIVEPENSYKVLDEMVEYVSSLLKKLNLPFRVLRLCGGDLSFTSALTYDFEVYSAGQEKWLEVSSVSNFEDYQANRLKLRMKDGNSKATILHTLNGSALALPRIMASIIENNYTNDGINIPECLTKYTSFNKIN